MYIIDPWGNKSDTLFVTIKPLYEMQFDKAKFMEYHLPSDSPTGYGWVMTNLWNGTIQGAGYHTALGNYVLPITFTFDMGIRGKLSRYTVWERSDYAYSHGNPSKWALWGSNNPNDDAMPTDVSGLAPGQTVGSWTFIGYFEGPLSGDVASVDAGFNYNISTKVPPLRYIRFETLNTYSEAAYVHLMEITFWGTIQ